MQKRLKILYSREEIVEAYRRALSWFPEERMKLLCLEVPYFGMACCPYPFSKRTEKKFQQGRWTRPICFLAFFGFLGFCVVSSFLSGSTEIGCVASVLLVFLLFSGGNPIEVFVKIRPRRGFVVRMPRFSPWSYLGVDLLQVAVHELMHVRQFLTRQDAVESLEGSAHDWTEQLLERIKAEESLGFFLNRLEAKG